MRLLEGELCLWGGTREGCPFGWAFGIDRLGGELCDGGAPTRGALAAVLLDYSNWMSFRAIFRAFL